MTWTDKLSAPDLTEKDFTDVLAEAIATELDGTSVSALAPLELRVVAGPDLALRCNLRGLWKTHETTPDEAPDAIERYLSSLREKVEAHRERSEPGRSAIRPTVQDTPFVESANQKYKRFGLSERLFAVSLVADLNVVYALDAGGSLTFITSRHLDRLELTPEEAAEVAHRNLLEEVRQMNLKVYSLQSEDGAEAFRFIADGMVETSLILLPVLCDQLAASVRGDLIASLPGRGVLLGAGSDESENLAFLAALTDEMYQESRYPVSMTLIRWTGSGWEEAN